MRKSLLFLLLAGAAMPALAADNPSDSDNDRAARREARAEARAERQAEPAQESPKAEPQATRSFEPSQQDRPQANPQPAEVVRERVVEHRSEGGFGGNSARPALEQRMVRSEPSQGAEPPRPTMEQQRDTTDSVRDWRSHERRVDNRPAAIEQQRDTTDKSSEWRSRERRVGNSPADVEVHNGTLGNGTLGNGSFRELRREPTGRDSIGNRRGPQFGGVPRQGMQPPLPNSGRQSDTNRLSSLTAQHWRHDWRSDHRYDWRNHRQRHGSLFHFGFYYDPFGWGYQRYSIGSRLWPNYYRSSYWLNDPWQYRLPYAPPGTRWVRYYDDAVLVDMWDGQVIDVIYDFFW